MPYSLCGCLSAMRLQDQIGFKLHRRSLTVWLCLIIALLCCSWNYTVHLTLTVPNEAKNFVQYSIFIAKPWHQWKSGSLKYARLGNITVIGVRLLLAVCAKEAIIRNTCFAFINTLQIRRIKKKTNKRPSYPTQNAPIKTHFNLTHTIIRTHTRIRLARTAWMGQWG